MGLLSSKILIINNLYPVITSLISTVILLFLFKIMQKLSNLPTIKPRDYRLTSSLDFRVTLKTALNYQLNSIRTNMEDYSRLLALAHYDQQSIRQLLKDYLMLMSILDGKYLHSSFIWAIWVTQYHMQIKLQLVIDLQLNVL